MLKRVVVLVVILLYGVFLCNPVSVSANNNSLQEELDSNNEAIERLEEEKEAVESEKASEEQRLKEIEENINLKSTEVTKIKLEIDKYQSDIDLLQEEISGIESEIDIIQSNIISKENAIESLEIEQEAKEALLDERIRNYYKLDVTKQYIYVILKSKSIFEAINNMNNVITLMKIDKKLINETKKEANKIQKEKEKLGLMISEANEKKNDILAKQQEVVDRQAILLVEKDKEEAVLSELRSMEGERLSIIKTLGERGDEIANQIGDLISYNAEIQKQLDDLLAGLGGDSGDENENVQEGEFLRPTSGYISCPFGPRINPVTGVPGMHNGIDYAANMDTPIVATKSGVIEYSGWISGYGNTIIINHGGGEQSLYAHANSLIGKVGQTVSQGEIIAYVGTTGMSTGPHLHFEIRINGTPMDPYLYIPY